MQNKWQVSLILISIFLFFGCSNADEETTPNSAPELTTIESTSSVNNSTNPDTTDFKARFEIYTNGTKRIFTDAKYHRQSADVYIENPDPHVVHVKKATITWNDFFTTLPFSLKKDCLVTGTKQTFCNTDTKRLYFYLNNEENPDVLDKVIAPNDELRVEYR